MGESKMAEKETVCRIAGCENVAVTRGLCRRCYQSASQAVKAGEVTWDKLVELGLANESKRKDAGPNPFTSALNGVLSGDDTAAPELPWQK
jgi:hypothetical protein